MSPFTSDEALSELQRKGRRHASIYVYEAPVRLWHWINAAAIVILAVTGYLIGSPPPSQPGQAYDTFVFGYIRAGHFIAGYVLAAAFIGRLYWALVGNHHARQLFYLPVWSRKWWSEVFFELRWYLFLERDPKKYVGHNPLAQLAMFTLFLLTLLFMIVTGFAMDAEIAGAGSWQHAAFGWVIALAGNTQNLHTWHHLGLWAMVVFVMIHVYAAIREDIMSRQTMVSTIINGLRSYKDDRP